MAYVEEVFDRDQTYSEFWLSDHPSGQASFLMGKDEDLCIGDLALYEKTKNKLVKLSELFRQHTEFLGAGYKERFSHLLIDKPHIPPKPLSMVDKIKLQLNQQLKPEPKPLELVSMLKVVSVRTSSAIRLHPDKATSLILHETHPEVFRDANELSKLVVALSDDFIAIAGFADPKVINENFSENEVLLELLPVLTLGKYYKPDASDPKFVHLILRSFFEKLDYGKRFLEDTAKRLESDIMMLDPLCRSFHQQAFLQIVG
jgi:mannose-6-phosphate isomerase class I